MHKHIIMIPKSKINNKDELKTNNFDKSYLYVLYIRKVNQQKQIAL